MSASTRPKSKQREQPAPTSEGFLPVVPSRVCVVSGLTKKKRLKRNNNSTRAETPSRYKNKGLYEKCCSFLKNLRWEGGNQTESIMNNKRTNLAKDAWEDGHYSGPESWLWMCTAWTNPSSTLPSCPTLAAKPQFPQLQDAKALVVVRI